MNRIHFALSPGNELHSGLFSRGPVFKSERPSLGKAGWSMRLNIAGDWCVYSEIRRALTVS